MNRLLISLVAAVMLFGIAGFAGVNRLSDTPKCCQNHETCCPKSPCCSGGQHTLCMMGKQRHA
jgi:hypothetical protein